MKRKPARRRSHRAKSALARTRPFEFSDIGTVAEGAAYLGCSAEHVRREIRRGALPAFRLTGAASPSRQVKPDQRRVAYRPKPRIRVCKGDLDAYLTARRLRGDVEQLLPPDPQSQASTCAEHADAEAR